MWGWFLDKAAGGLLVGVILALLGSYLIPRINEHYRGRREHLNKAVDALRSQIEDIICLSVEYWTSKRTDEFASKEAVLNYKLNDIATLTQICATEIWTKQDSVGPVLVGKLIGAVVTDQFGVPKRPADPSRVPEILSAAQALADAIASSRHDYFGKRINWSLWAPGGTRP